MYDNIEYAKCYDLLYAKKDYKSDVENIVNILGLQPGSNIIDIGCGTGNYTNYLSMRGFNVTGIEPSEYMLTVAKNKNIKANFFKGYMHEYPLEQSGFDAAIAMFNIINHIQDLSNLYQFFDSIYSRIRDGAKMAFDCYNGYECIVDPPRNNIITHETNLGTYKQTIKNINRLSEHKSTLDIEIETPENKLIKVKCDVVFWSINVIVDILKELSFKNVNVLEKSKRTYIITTER